MHGNGTGKDGYGTPCVITHILMNDGTGATFLLYEDGSSDAAETSWTMNSDGTYSLSSAGKPGTAWTLDADADSVVTTHGNTLEKCFADSAYYLSYLGKWMNKDNGDTLFLCGDGTGLVINGASGKIATFSWTIPAFGELKVKYLSGTALDTGESIAGTEYTFTYDRDADVFVSGLTGTRYAHEIRR